MILSLERKLHGILLRRVYGALQLAAYAFELVLSGLACLLGRHAEHEQDVQNDHQHEHDRNYENGHISLFLLHKTSPRKVSRRSIKNEPSAAACPPAQALSRNGCQDGRGLENRGITPIPEVSAVDVLLIELYHSRHYLSIPGVLRR